MLNPPTTALPVGPHTTPLKSFVEDDPSVAPSIFHCPSELLTNVLDDPEDVAVEPLIDALCPPPEMDILMLFRDLEAKLTFALNVPDMFAPPAFVQYVPFAVPVYVPELL